MFIEVPGWKGAFTRNRAEGALENGTRVKKTMTEDGDAHPLGSLATVLGSLSAPEIGIGYFVEWDANPKHAVFVAAKKIAPT